MNKAKLAAVMCSLVAVTLWLRTPTSQRKPTKCTSWLGQKEHISTSDSVIPINIANVHHTMEITLLSINR